MATTRKAPAAKKPLTKKAPVTPRKRTRPAVAPKSVSTIASIPEPRYHTEYISRKFNGITEFDIFDFAKLMRRNVLIEGPTGPGKTSAALAYAALRLNRFYAIPSNIGIEPSQLFGKYIPAEGGGFIWVDGPVTDIIRNGGLLLINEVNFMPERVATVLFGLLDKRREIVLLDHKGERVRAHWGKGECWCDEKDCTDKMVLVLADMNPEYEGTRPLNKAFRNRFAVQLWWDYDEAIEKKLVASVSLVDMASRIRDQASRGDFETPVATNMLQEFEEVYYKLGLEFAITNFVNHFESSERAPIDTIVRTFSVNIQGELDDAVDDGSDDDDEADLEARVNDEDNEDEWGEEGVDWVYEDEDDD